MSAAPAVSVCIPAYRGAAHIGEAIESVLAQTLADFELVVVDDASPDDTAAVVARYRDARIRFLRNVAGWWLVGGFMDRWFWRQSRSFLRR